MPEDDRFVLVSEHDAEGFHYPAQYLGNEHSADLVMIKIALRRGRSVRCEGGKQRHLTRRWHTAV